MTLRELARTGGISILAALLFVCCAVAQVPPPASTAPWEPVGRVAGGAVDAVVFDTAHPGVAFAGSDSAYLYRSRDGGANWTTQPDVFYDVSAGFSLLSGTRGKVFWADTSGALYVAPDEALH